MSTHSKERNFFLPALDICPRTWYNTAMHHDTEPIASALIAFAILVPFVSFIAFVVGFLVEDLFRELKYSRRA
jgi:hypothetical protein